MDSKPGLLHHRLAHYKTLYKFEVKMSAVFGGMGLTRTEVFSSSFHGSR